MGTLLVDVAWRRRGHGGPTPLRREVLEEGFVRRRGALLVGVAWRRRWTEEVSSLKPKSSWARMPFWKDVPMNATMARQPSAGSEFSSLVSEPGPRRLAA
jgi:hypothetical protein